MPTEEPVVKVLTGTVTLYTWVDADYNARLTIDMMSTRIGLITKAEITDSEGAAVKDVSDKLTGKFIILGSEITAIHLHPKDAVFRSDDPSP